MKTLTLALCFALCGLPGSLPAADGSAEKDAVIARMRAMLQERKWKELVAEFGPEDFAAWPAKQAAAALQVRGQVYSFLKDGPHAQADLEKAAQLAPEDAVVWLTLGENSYTNFSDDEAALAAFRKALAITGKGNGWQPMTAVTWIARILTDQVKTDEALAALKPWGNLETVAPSWRIRMLRAYGHIYAARGQEQESLVKFREALQLETKP